MKRFLHTLAALPLAIVFLSSCSSDKLEVKDKNFTEEIEQLQNLDFTFNQDLVADSQLSKGNVWLEESLLTITPAVKGKYMWMGKNKLRFSPEIGFAPTTDYKIEVSEALLKKSSKKLSMGESNTFNVHTPYFNLVQSNSYWARNENNKSQIELRLELKFNYKLTPSDLKSLLQLIIDGKPRSFEVTGANAAEQVTVLLPEGNGEKLDDKELTISVKPGLKCVENPNYVTKTEMQLKALVPSKDNFQVLGAEGMYEDEQAYIQVQTNQQLADQDLNTLITITPKIDFTTEPQSSGFKIIGAFVNGSNYKLRINKKLQGTFGTGLKDDYEQEVSFGVHQPYIGFVSKKGIYLTNKGQKNVAIKILHVPEIKVTIFKVYENNLLQFLRKNNYSYYYDDYEGYYGSSDYYGYNDLGDVVLQQTYNTRSLKKDNGVSLLNLDFNDINAFKGMFLVKVESTTDQWINSSKMVSISDLGLIVRESEDEIHVFANSILGATPLSGADINLISSNNQMVYSLKTDNQGVAHFTDLKKKAPGFKVAMITCRMGEDFNYLWFENNRVETSQYETGGAYVNSSGYDAYIYGDREIYRPGDSVYVNVIVRDQKWQPLSSVPVKLKVYLPNGKEFINLKGILDREGAFPTGFKLPASTVTGTYSMEVYSANDVLLNSRSISVEEFIPDRIKVNASVNKDQVRVDEELTVSATALNLFGPPAADRNYEMELALRRKYFSPKNFSDYTFDIYSGGNRDFDKTLRQGKTNAQGGMEERFTFAEACRHSGILEGKVFITVFDESGRPVHQVKTVDVLTQDVYYGIKYFDYYVNTSENLEIPVIGVDKDGKALSGKTAQVQIIRYNWQTVLEHSYGDRYRYVSQKKEVVLMDKNITLTASGNVLNFRPGESGEYEVRIKNPNASSYVRRYFYAYGYGSTSNNSFEVNTEGDVSIQANKDKYEVGEEAELLFKTPFVGTLLVTVERNKVYDYFYINTDKRSASLKLPIKEDYLPNIYVSATLIKPNGETSIPLTVAHGYTPLTVERKALRLPVNIVSAENSRSNTRQKITVKTKASSGIQVTLAVVDEGILQLKNTKSPDPYEFFFRKKALQVLGYDLYAKLLPELSGRKSSVAGDGYDLEKRVNPLGNKRVKLVSYWRAVASTNGNGEADFYINIPQFSGSLRMMAVAYQGNSFGAASKNMRVADPVVVSTSLPRFSSPGDTLQVPVTLTNTTASATSATAQLQVSGPLMVVGESTRSVALAANAEGRVMFKVLAKAEVGEAKITTLVNALNEKFKEENDITVRPASSLVKTSGAGQVAGNSTQSINLGTDFVASSVKTQLVVSQSPIVQWTGSLDYLLGYPHGCVEQTVSKAFPQIYFNDLVKSLKATRQDTQDANYNVQEAIRKLSGMQLESGALSYWPGGYNESWWGTVYATHFLMEAKKAGFEVGDKMLDRLYNYLRHKVKEKSVEEYYYYEGNAYRTKSIPSKDIFYSLYVLAQAGKPDLATMNYYKSVKSQLALDSRYLLANTYYMLGDRSSFNAILPGSFEGEVAANVFGGNFYSYIRDMAIALNALLDNDPGNAQVGVLAQHLTREMKKDKYLSTQEQAFAFIALGKLARRTNASALKAQVKANGKVIGSYTGGILTLSSGLYGANLTLETQGSGMLFYFWKTEGLSQSGKVQEEDSFLKVRRTFYDRSGNPITNMNFNQNDLVVVKISASVTDNSSVDNVVITDMLPAGFEVENPRLTETSDMPWIRNRATPEHFDIRDDRVNLYTQLTRENRDFYYIVRAVSKGTFVLGPVSADAMYNGEYHSYYGSGKITIK